MEHKPYSVLLSQLVGAAIAIAPWVSASLSELQPGHTGEYEKVAEEFLGFVQEIIVFEPKK